MSSTWARGLEFAFALWFGFGFGFGFGKGGDGDGDSDVVLLAKNAANGAVNKYLFNLWF